MQTGATEQVDRAVFAEEISAANFEECARCHVQVLGGDPGVLVGAQPLSSLDPAAVPDRCDRGFVDADQDVASPLVPVAQFGDADATEQAERGEAALALVHLLKAERFA